MDTKALKILQSNTLVNHNGELIVNAGKYSRGMIVLAFELNGGIETFATWAAENKTDFYTKLFGKLIGREEANTQSDSVEELLKILDGEAEDITDQVNEASEAEFSPPPMTEARIKLMEAARIFAENEPVDDI